MSEEKSEVGLIKSQKFLRFQPVDDDAFPTENVGTKSGFRHVMPNRMFPRDQLL